MKNIITLTLFIFSTFYCYGQENETSNALIAPSDPLPEALTDGEITKLTSSVDSGLKALVKLQHEDGSFSDTDTTKPAITSFVIMAYISRGHKPGMGPFGELLEKALEYVLSCQQENGLLAFSMGHNGSYSHAICMLMLGEVYGLTNIEKSVVVKKAIVNGLTFTTLLWNDWGTRRINDGGFRYKPAKRNSMDSDLSVTAWHSASLRSVKNAGFEIPERVMDLISKYVIRMQKNDGGFAYIYERKSTYIMTAAGTLCVAFSGKHNHPALKRSSLYLSKFKASSPAAFKRHNSTRFPYQTCYYMTQASIQMGGQLWVNSMKEVYNCLVPRQEESGRWPSKEYGDAYSTSLAILSLTPSLKLLPLYQR